MNYKFINGEASEMTGIKQAIYPRPLRRGDHVRVIAPSRALSVITGIDTGDYLAKVTTETLGQWGLRVSFGRHVEEIDYGHVSPVDLRVTDLHEAFADPSVDGILTVIGGDHSNEMLPLLDYELIRNNPKVFCGYSDITALHNAINAKTGLVTFSGPHWSTFGMRDYNETTCQSFSEAVLGDGEIVWQASDWFTDDQWYLDQDERSPEPNDGWWIIQPGRAEGRTVGSNLSTFCLLNGTEYQPDLDGTVLFVEATIDHDLGSFRRLLVSIFQQPAAADIRAVIIGRFQKGSGVDREALENAIASLSPLQGIPVIANVDFGHTNPMLTFPVGGTVRVLAEGNEASIALSRATLRRSV